MKLKIINIFIVFFITFIMNFSYIQPALSEEYQVNKNKLNSELSELASHGKLESKYEANILDNREKEQLLTSINEWEEKNSIVFTPQVKMDLLQYRTQGHSYGSLDVKSIPEDCEVYIDNSFVEYSNKEFILTEGSHPVSLKKDGFQNFDTDVKIETGKKYNLKCKLDKIGNINRKK